MPDNNYEELVRYLIEYLQKLGYTVTHALAHSFEEPPEIGGFRPDVVANLKNLKTVYGVALLPDNVMTRETWELVRTLSANKDIPLFIAFPEKDKQLLILSLINGKLMEKPNILRIYK